VALAAVGIIILLAWTGLLGAMLVIAFYFKVSLFFLMLAYLYYCMGDGFNSGDYVPSAISAAAILVAVAFIPVGHVRYAPLPTAKSNIRPETPFVGAPPPEPQKHHQRTAYLVELLLPPSTGELRFFSFSLPRVSPTIGASPSILGHGASSF
jgi:hypothetical protein